MRALRGVRKLKCVNYADDDRSRKMVGMRELFRCRVVAATHDITQSWVSHPTGSTQLYTTHTLKPVLEWPIWVSVHRIGGRRISGPFGSKGWYVNRMWAIAVWSRWHNKSHNTAPQCRQLYAFLACPYHVLSTTHGCAVYWRRGGHVHVFGVRVRAHMCNVWWTWKRGLQTAGGHTNVHQTNGLNEFGTQFNVLLGGMILRI